ncbi:Mechanosensitive ion channel protein Msy1 [Rhodotorula toruloides]|nr:Mechanosensitive ion channel protein Msy1 [Rhodotorula toruloides]KAJ8292407.1 Mechanosensitive ion channel protein Msy1 [Rhodotorula toruloides]
MDMVVKAAARQGSRSSATPTSGLTSSPQEIVSLARSFRGSTSKVRVLLIHFESASLPFPPQIRLRLDLAPQLFHPATHASSPSRTQWRSLAGRWRGMLTGPVSLDPASRFRARSLALSRKTRRQPAEKGDIDAPSFFAISLSLLAQSIVARRMLLLFVETRRNADDVIAPFRSSLSALLSVVTACETRKVRQPKESCQSTVDAILSAKLTSLDPPLQSSLALLAWLWLVGRTAVEEHRTTLAHRAADAEEGEDEADSLLEDAVEDEEAREQRCGQTTRWRRSTMQTLSRTACSVRSASSLRSLASHVDLISCRDDRTGFNASPVFQPIPTPQQYSTTHSPAQTGYSTPIRGGRGGRGGAGFPRGGGRGGTPNRSGAATPEHGRSYGQGGRGAFRGVPHQGLGVFNARGRGGTSGSFTPGRGGYSSSPGEYNPLLVPVKFVKASGAGLGTVGGEDEHGLEKAGAEAPPKPSSADVALADKVGRMDLYDGDEGKGPPPETAFEPEPETTATMALDELEDVHAATSTAHPGLGSRVQPADAVEAEDTPASMTEPSRPDSPADDEPPLFEISVTRSDVTVELSSTLPPPAALVERDDTAESSSSDEDEEQVVYPPRAVSHADPVTSTRPPPAEPVQAETLDFTSLPTPSVKPPAPKAPHPALPTAPAHKSKKALKRASKIARKTGRAHARSENAHLGGGKMLGAEDEDDLEEGRQMFARLQGAAGVDDMLAELDEDEESDEEEVNGGAEQEHEEGQPRMDDSDLDWGSASPPPVGLGARAQARGRAKKQAQRQQRADQRQAEKLERLIAAGSTREEIELALAIEMSIEEAEEAQRQVQGRSKRDQRARQKQRTEEDYLQNADFDEGDDSMAVLAAFAKGAVGGLAGTHQRGDDLDRRLVEEAEDAEWGTSDEDSDEDDSDEDETSDDEEDDEERYIRRLAREEEDMSEEVDSDVELEMDYALGDADGQVEHSLSIATDSSEASDFDSSLSSSTDSEAEGLDVAEALLAGGTVRLSMMGQAGGGGRKAERERKKERRRERKGKMRAMEESDEDEDDDDDDEAMLFQGNDTWADRDEEYIARVQNAVRANADLLSTAQGGRAARRANRRERNKLFKAISEGNFEDVALYDDAEDLDDEMIEAMFAEEEERGFGSMSKKQRKKDKSFGGAFSSTLAAQWDLDRQSKARKKAERAALRASQNEAEYRDSYRTKGGKKGKKALKAAREAADQSNDAATVNRRIRHFIVNEIGEQSVSLPPMSKKARIAVHLLAEVYGLKSRSMGKGNSRFPVLERTSKTTVIGVSERRVRAIVGTAEGENELEDGYEAFGGIGRRGRGGGKMAGLWKALEGASGKGKFGAGGRGGGLGKNSEGAVVGEGADKLGEDNVGFALLKKMGWTEGAQIGLSGGILEPTRQGDALLELSPGFDVGSTRKEPIHISHPSLPFAHSRLVVSWECTAHFAGKALRDPLDDEEGRASSQRWRSFGVRLLLNRLLCLIASTTLAHRTRPLAGPMSGANTPHSYSERSSSRSRAQGAPDRANTGPSAPPIPTSYPPASTAAPSRAYAPGLQSTETTPLAYDTSPNLGSSQTASAFTAHDFARSQQQQAQSTAEEPYTAISLGDPSQPSGGGFDAVEHYGPLTTGDDETGDLSNSLPRTSLSTHNSRTQLRAAAAGGAYLPTGSHMDAVDESSRGASHVELETHVDSRPVHPGPSVKLPQSDRAEKMYGSGMNEKGGTSAPGSGYSTPRSRSAERSRGGGLGQWSGPAGGNSPYGRLGDSGPGTGAQTPNGGWSAASSNPNVQFADGDFIRPTNWFSRMVFAIYNSHYIVRWTIYILPVLAILWIPAIVQWSSKHGATIWTVELVWWSIWLTVVWTGYWGAMLVGRLGPTLLNKTLGVVAPELRHYIAYVKAIRFYASLAGWALANWISFLPLIRRHEQANKSDNTLYLITQGLFGIFIILVILLIEKLIIQVIAHNFHKRSYEDRIIEQKFQIGALVNLYLNSRDIGRSDTLDGAFKRPRNKRQVSDPTLLIKKALKGAQKAAQTATTMIGTVASEIAGERVLQPNSPPSMVTSALQSTNKTRQLARRIYYSFTPQYREGMVITDIERCFPNREEAERAFAIFDRDLNGDATLDEVEMACLDIHRERLALGRSMRDIDSAVGRLDNIIMSIWYVVAILIMVGLLDASFQTMIAGAGTFILGLSWLIGTTAQEILASVIFLFIKHPYDVGDRVSIDAVDYIVLEMHLLSTVFKKIDGTVTQAPHSLLNTKFVMNYRRSNSISETFTFDVDFGTSFEKIEALRARMLEFLQQERRDFVPTIDITVQDFAAQGKLSLSAPINYKGNWQNGALKVQRRNKWVCALKVALAELQIFGPAGAGDPAPAPPDPTPYTEVPWDEVKAAREKAAAEAAAQAGSTTQDVHLHHAAEFGEHLISDDDVRQEEAGDGIRYRRHM